MSFFVHARFALVPAVLAAMVSSAAATLVSETDGGDSVTLDSASGIEWLDASNTLGMVVSTAIADFPDYHLATQNDVETLLEDAGYPAADLPNGDTTDSTSGDLLATTLGYSFNTWVQYYGSEASTWEYQSQADYLDGAGTGVDEVVLDARNPPLGSDGTYVNFYALGNSFGTGDSQNFVLLIKSTPEPSSAVLLAVGTLAGGLAWMLRRRAHPHWPRRA
ncbi:MAG TPA: PEP-CTERM sorting domain-containing protein, partial [Pirellulales bacterium]